jgi:methylmalonyl-CoA mutase
VPAPTIAPMTTESVSATPPDADAGLQAWRRAVAGVLAKARRVDAADLGDTPERLLDTTTYDGVTLAALYTPADQLPEPPLPGVHPFTRGRTAHRDTTVGWGVRTRHGRGLGPGADAEAVNTAVLHDLENGSTSLWFALGGQDLPHAALERALDGVFLDLAPVVLDAGAEMTAAAEAFLAVLEHTDADLTEVHAHLGADPLTVLVRGGPDLLGEAVALAVRAHEHTAPLTSITVDGTVFHDAGAGDAQELGAALAAGVEYLRALTGGGLDVDDALGQLEFRVAATDEQFATLAKLRAGRTLWARVAQVVGGAPASGAAPQHAVTSAAMMSQRDPWVNMLRTTVAAFAAGVGGADAVTVLPFDSALPDGVPGVSGSFAARMARNTQLLLLEESHLGRVLDPAGGSYYAEQLTAALGEAAWAFFTELEAAGGFRAALASGLLAERIAATARARASDIARRTAPLTGVSEFPDLAEAPPTSTTEPVAPGALPVTRRAQPFEVLRNRSDAHLESTGARPQVRLVALGPLAEHTLRLGWTTNLLAAGGLEAGGGSGPVAVLVGTDARYCSDGPDALAAARAGGATTVLLAGPPKAWPSDAPDRPDGNLAAGADAVAALSRLLDTLTADTLTADTLTADTSEVPS